jgi:glucose/arabinose dehydrogenase
VGNSLYVADTDAVLRFPCEEGKQKFPRRRRRGVNLPAGPINHHWTQNLIASADGCRLYVAVGSNGNAGERDRGGGGPCCHLGVGDSQMQARVFFIPLDSHDIESLGILC